jgi:preprotein translocase subunit SecE
MKRFIQRFLKFLHDVRIELKKVHWPSKREFTVFTGIVLFVVLVVGVFFWGLDTVFLAVLQLIIAR